MIKFTMSLEAMIKHYGEKKTAKILFKVYKQVGKHGFGEEAIIMMSETLQCKPEKLKQILLKYYPFLRKKTKEE